MFNYFTKIIFSILIFSLSFSTYACKESWICFCNKDSSSSRLPSIRDKYTGKAQPAVHLKASNSSSNKEIDVTINTCKATRMKQKNIQPENILDVIVTSDITKLPSGASYYCYDELYVMMKKTNDTSVEVFGALKIK